ncbi:DUF4283 domain-containing protein, partial [Cephalotus follicularis]
AAVWMRFPGLPLPLHNPSFLKAIGNSLGRFLCTDANTAKFKHPRAAQMCVEMNLSEPPPPAFIVAIGDMKFHQRILIESRTLYCSFAFYKTNAHRHAVNAKGRLSLCLPLLRPQV